jgi:hypothetical protein
MNNPFFGRTLFKLVTPTPKLEEKRIEEIVVEKVPHVIVNEQEQLQKATDEKIKNLENMIEALNTKLSEKKAPSEEKTITAPQQQQQNMPSRDIHPLPISLTKSLNQALKASSFFDSSVNIALTQSVICIGIIVMVFAFIYMIVRLVFIAKNHKRRTQLID